MWRRKGRRRPNVLLLFVFFIEKDGAWSRGQKTREILAIISTVLRLIISPNAGQPTVVIINFFKCQYSILFDFCE